MLARRAVRAALQRCCQAAESRACVASSSSCFSYSSSAQDGSKGDDDAPSTSGQPASLGWLRGPEHNKPNKQLEDEWEEVRSEDGAVAWRSLLTGETTVPGAPKPDTWTEVVDRNTGLLYYWCKRTGEVTTLGEPKPGPYGRRAQLDPDSEAGAALGAGEGAGLPDEGGRKGGGGGPSMMRLVMNPLVLGVGGMALLAIAYEVAFK